ncbi:hypothetical protein JZO76_06495 [Enterococcus sp. MJM12]|uniref:Bacteriocin transport accessory protein n=1 Tax=Candidatus Enterococcus myersii TaxID=2815322 RepID=A0ABS3H6U9_9ENTE|nr:hypothetical protein [Enterococcus sp. MJM12]MBO0449185.1 hypothetical protein [Enterococcus sp. MJM12]
MKLVKSIGSLSLFLCFIFITQISYATTMDTSDSEREIQIENEIQNNDELIPQKQSDFSDSSNDNSNSTSDQQENKDFSVDSEVSTDSSVLTVEETSDTLAPTKSNEEIIQEEATLNEPSESQEPIQKPITETTIQNESEDSKESEIVNDSTLNTDEEVSVDEYMENVADFNKISITDVENLFYTEGETVLYIGRPTCYYCRQFSPELKKFNELIGDTLSYYDIDGSDFDEQAADLIFVKIGIPGTPTTMYIKDGQVLSAWVGGEISGQELYNFLYQNKENPANEPDEELVELPTDSDSSDIKDVQENEIVTPVKTSDTSSVNSTLQTHKKRNQIELSTTDSVSEKHNVIHNIKLSQSKNETNSNSNIEATLPKLSEKKSSLTTIGLAFLFLTGSLFIGYLKKSEEN